MNERPQLLDLCCGAGGGAMGYYLAGFGVTGVDVVDQPHYPFMCIQDDVFDYLGYIDASVYDAIHASPPCQAYSVTRSLHGARYPELVEQMREALEATGLPYVIENVVGAPLTNCVTLCGSSFGLGVRRHRRFETNWTVWNPPACRHEEQPEPIDVTGTGGPGGRHRKPRNLAHAREAMGIDWMTRPELSEAVPPAYTEWLGARLLEHLKVGVS